MEYQVNLDSEKYGELIRTLSVLKEPCNDVVINKGFIRQRSTDSAAVFEINLTSLLSEASFIISNIKEKIDSFKMFLEQEVQIQTDDTSFTFSDSQSSLKILHPDKNYLDNKYIEEAELNNLISVSEDAILTEHSISPMISERMKIISTGFHVNSFQMIFEGETASIKSRTMSKEQLANLIGNILLGEKVTGYSNLVIIPYVCDHDGDIICKVYKLRDKFICKYSMFVGSVPVTIYTRGEIKTEG
jgi:hypothetical protein